MKLIVTADLHLRYDAPLCRIDPDWMQSQRDMLKFIVSSANEREADIAIVGDVYDSYLVPVSVSTMFLQEMRKCYGHVYVLGGNHTLKNHREENAHESSIGVLKYVGGNITYLVANEEKTDGRFEHSQSISDDTVLIHTLAFKTQEEIPFGVTNATSAYALIEKYNTFKTLLLGDNHHSFLIEDDTGIVVINPGTPIIQKANMIGYKPSIFCVDTQVVDVTVRGDKNPAYRRVAPVERISVPYIEEFVTADHLEEKKERDGRIQAFVETIKKNGEVSLSFEDNLRAVMESSSLSEDVVSIFDELFTEAKNVN